MIRVSCVTLRQRSVPEMNRARRSFGSRRTNVEWHVETAGSRSDPATSIQLAGAPPAYREESRGESQEHFTALHHDRDFGERAAQELVVRDQRPGVRSD